MEITNEQWKHFDTTRSSGRNQTDGRERYWWISDHGRVKVTTNYNDFVKWPKLSLTGGHPNSRYLAISLNTLKQKYVHKLVAMYFCYNPFTDQDNRRITVDHIDGNKMNNHYTNLEWVTMSENRQRFIAKKNDPNYILGSQEVPQNGITRSQQDQMFVEYYKLGYTLGQTADHFGTTVGKVYRPIKAYRMENGLMRKKHEKG